MDDFDLAFDDNFRFLSREHFVHCHNKLIVVDDEKVLLGRRTGRRPGLRPTGRPASWSSMRGSPATSPGIFDADWELERAAGAAPSYALGGESRPASEFAQGGVVMSSARDYLDV